MLLSEIVGFQDRRHRLRSRPMYVLFRYGIQTSYTAIIIIMIIIIIIIITIIEITRLVTIIILREKTVQIWI